MNTAPGWYVVTNDESLEQYFNGSMWIGARRPRQDETSTFPGAANRPTPPSADTMGGPSVVGVVLYILAALALIGTLIAGIALIAHKGHSCSQDPYADAIGADVEDCTTTHPFRNSGWGVLAGGLVQSFLLIVVAYLCVTVDRMRRQLT